MKNIILTAAFVATAISSIAQKTEVRYTETNFDASMKISSYIEIPDANKKLVEKRWVSYLKDFDGKVREHDDEYFSDNAKISSLSPDTLDIYSKVESVEKAVRVTVAINRNGEYINNRTGTLQAVDDFITKFAVEMRKEVIKNKIEDAENVLGDYKRTEHDLVRSNEKLENDIKDYRSKIADAERDIINNKSSLENTKKLIETQDKVVDELKKSLDKVD
jgi:hypothetical protein